MTSNKIGNRVVEFISFHVVELFIRIYLVFRTISSNQNTTAGRIWPCFRYLMSWCDLKLERVLRSVLAENRKKSLSYEIYQLNQNWSMAWRHILFLKTFYQQILDKIPTTMTIMWHNINVWKLLRLISQHWNFSCSFPTLWLLMSINIPPKTLWLRKVLIETCLE